MTILLFLFLLLGSLCFMIVVYPWFYVIVIHRPGCSKLTTCMPLINVSLRFQTLISEKCQKLLSKKCEKLLQCKSFSHCFNKTISDAMSVFWL